MNTLYKKAIFNLLKASKNLDDINLSFASDKTLKLLTSLYSYAQEAESNQQSASLSNPWTLQNLNNYLKLINENHNSFNANVLVELTRIEQEIRNKSSVMANDPEMKRQVFDLFQQLLGMVENSSLQNAQPYLSLQEMKQFLPKILDDSEERSYELQPMLRPYKFPTSDPAAAAPAAATPSAPPNAMSTPAAVSWKHPLQVQGRVKDDIVRRMQTILRDTLGYLQNKGNKDAVDGWWGLDTNAAFKNFKKVNLKDENMDDYAAITQLFKLVPHTTTESEDEETDTSDEAQPKIIRLNRQQLSGGYLSYIKVLPTALKNLEGYVPQRYKSTFNQFSLKISPVIQEFHRSSSIDYTKYYEAYKIFEKINKSLQTDTSASSFRPNAEAFYSNLTNINNSLLPLVPT